MEKKSGKIPLLIAAIVIVVAGFFILSQKSVMDSLGEVAMTFYSTFNKGVDNFQKIDIGSTISQASKQLLTPSPLTSERSGDSQVILLQSKIIAETNFQRMLSSIAPLQPLKENAKLNDAAAAKAMDMFKNQYFEHLSPTGIDPGKLVQNYSYDYIVAGENLILGNFSSEKEVVQDWMDSPGHRANILNTRYTEIGVAIIKGTYQGRTVWIGVQEFGLPIASCSQPDFVLKNKIDSDKAELDALSSQIDQKKKQIDSTSRQSPAYQAMVSDYNELVTEYNALAEQIKSSVASYNNQVNTFNACVAGS